jgi:TRAP-type uncharacterized transport system fused permease subunit
VLPKLLVDQFGYSVFWSAPSQTILTRWHALHYSTREVWRELRTDMIFRRMLPVLVTNWMFWIPIIILVYLMPLNLQVPLAVVATAIWGLLLNAAARQPRTRAVETASDLALDTSL